MDVGISSNDRVVDDELTEVVERKGSGHPDTLADRIAEQVSQRYAAYCLSNFGLVLHHNADKTALLGGSSRVRFGGGQVTGPVLATVNGRFSEQYAGEHIPVIELVSDAVREVFDATLVHFDSTRDLRVSCRNNPSSSPGFVDVEGHGDVPSGTRSRWFAPSGPEDVTPSDAPHANDTSCGVGFAPRSRMERLVLNAETFIRTVGERYRPGCVGTDVKVMATRVGRRLRLTAAVPVVDSAADGLDHYLELRELVRGELTGYAETQGYEPTVVVNARDKVEIPELYLTVTGSSIESGDEGVVGRGNRCNGLITPGRPMSIEGACGKNPIYHVGKLYNVIAEQAAAQLHQQTGCHVGVTIVSLTGHPLREPAFVGVRHSGSATLPETLVRSVIETCMSDLSSTRDQLIAGKIELF